MNYQLVLGGLASFHGHRGWYNWWESGLLQGSKDLSWAPFSHSMDLSPSLSLTSLELWRRRRWWWWSMDLSLSLQKPKDKSLSYIYRYIYIYIKMKRGWKGKWEEDGYRKGYKEGALVWVLKGQKSPNNASRKRRLTAVFLPFHRGPLHLIPSPFLTQIKTCVFLFQS